MDMGMVPVDERGEMIVERPEQTGLGDSTQWQFVDKYKSGLRSQITAFLAGTVFRDAVQTAAQWVGTMNELEEHQDQDKPYEYGPFQSFEVNFLHREP